MIRNENLRKNCELCGEEVEELVPYEAHEVCQLCLEDEEEEADAIDPDYDEDES